jgi:hypothetical protein
VALRGLGLPWQLLGGHGPEAWAVHAFNGPEHVRMDIRPEPLPGMPQKASVAVRRRESRFLSPWEANRDEWPLRAMVPPANWQNAIKSLAALEAK